MVNINLLEDEKILGKVNASYVECSGGLLYVTNKRVGYMNDASEETYNISLKDIQDFYIGDSEDEEPTINIIEFGKAEGLPEIFIVDRDDVNNFYDLLECAIRANNNQDYKNCRNYVEDNDSDNNLNADNVTIINVPKSFIVFCFLGLAILSIIMYRSKIFSDNSKSQIETEKETESMREIQKCQECGISSEYAPVGIKKYYLKNMFEEKRLPIYLCYDCYRDYNRRGELERNN